MHIRKLRYRDRRGVIRETSTWYVQFRDHRRIVRRLAAGRVKADARAIGAKLERLASLAAAGEPPTPEMVRWIDGLPPRLLDKLARWGLVQATTAASVDGLGSHVDAWEAAMEASGVTAGHAKQQATRVRRVVEGLPVDRWNKLSAEVVQAAVEALGRERGWGAGTRAAYLTALKSWGRWMVMAGRAGENPLARLRKPQAAPGSRRRALSDDEARRLLAAAQASTRRLQGLDGPQRALLYRLALETGLRARELAALEPRDIDPGPPPTLRARPLTTKNRKGATLPLRAETSALLGQLSGPVLFPLGPSPRFAELVRHDLKAAKIPAEDTQGRRVDFHALRHTFVTNLARSGVPVHVAQRLARHSTPHLTLAVYAHVEEGEKRAAIEGLPDLD